MKRLLSVCFAACLLLLSAFSVSGQKKAGVVKIAEKDNGKTIHLKPRQAFDVLFAGECVGCQYVWATTQIDSTKIKFLSNTYSKRSCTNCVGGTHDNTFHFKSRKAGSSTLAFKYFDKTFSIKLVAK